MEFAFLGVILGLVSVILVRVAYTARDVNEIKVMLSRVLVQSDEKEG
ncbi:MAG: hypothetical protein PVG75_07565 [Thioalkalispiraceae bacterium]|jgi:hypothetical protein